MDVFGTVTGAIGLAATAFTTAKSIRDNIKLATSEKAEIADLIEENEEEMQLLQDLYDKHKESLDQTELTQDLERLQIKMKELNDFLASSKGKMSGGKTLNVMEIWRAGDLKPKLEAWNRRINRVRSSWQDRINTRTLALVQKSKIEILDRMDSQNRANANASLAVVETIRSEATEVIKVIQQTTVRQGVRSLSIHSQVQPAGSNSQITRVVADVTTSMVSFSILAPDASLSYDSIKLRLETYKELLATDSPTIEFATERGKTIICRKELEKMEAFLAGAEMLLQNIIESRDVSTIAAVLQLRQLAQALDYLRLEDECRLVGNCTLNLSQALALRSLEFRLEHAQTIAVIAGLSVYQPRIRTLFTQAIAICEEVVAEDGSDPNKETLLVVLSAAGYSATNQPALSVEWLSRALKIITTELPSTSFTVDYCRAIYLCYSSVLFRIGRYSEAVEAGRDAVFYNHTSVENNTATVEAKINTLGQNPTPVGLLFETPEAILKSQKPLDARKRLQAAARGHYSRCLTESGQYLEAERMGRESVSLYRALASEDPVEHDGWLANSLRELSHALRGLGKYEESVAGHEEGITMIRRLVAQDPAGNNCLLLSHLLEYAPTTRSLGDFPKTVEVLKEAISLYRVVFPENPKKHGCIFVKVLETYGDLLTDLGKWDEATTARKEVLSLRCLLASHNPARDIDAMLIAFWKYHDLVSMKPQSPTGTVEVYAEVVACLRNHMTPTNPKYQVSLGPVLWALARSYVQLEQHEHAIPVFEESVMFLRNLSAEYGEDHRRVLANSLHHLAISLHALKRFEQAEAAAVECVELYERKVPNDWTYLLFCVTACHNGDQCFICQRVSMSDPCVSA